MDGDPKTPAVHHGPLYLQVNDSVREMWTKDIAGNDQKAGQQWSGERVRTGFDSM